MADKKTFDVAKPGQFTPASATSRPVIVPNRPIMRDPMMTPISPSGDGAPVKKASGTGGLLPSKISIKPLSESSDSTPAAKTDSTSEPVSIAVKLNGAGSSAPKTDATEAAAAPQQANALDAEPDAKPADKPADKASTKASDKADETRDGDYDKFGDSNPNSDAGVPDKSQIAKAEAAAEAEQKKQAELDELVEKKQYFVSVNSVEKRRSRYEIVFGLLVIVFLGLMLLNFLLDAGFVQINGLHPFTHLFGNP